MKKTGIIQNNNAVSGVIEALLIIALVSIILATIQLYYIPDIMEDKEKDHMAEVEKQFSYLKSTIDIQSMTKEKILISSPITLGSKELPYFVTIGSTGQININNESDVGSSRLKIQPFPDLDIFPLGYINDKDGIPLTSIEYKAHNSYISDCKYILEGGAIISKTPDKGMLVKPSMIIENTSDTKITIYYSLPFFTSSPGKKQDASGYADPDKTIFVHTNYTTHRSEIISDVTSIEFFTEYLDAWNQTLNASNGLLREYYDNGYISIQRDDSQTPPVIKIEPIALIDGGKNIDIQITVVKIGVQIGPGIIRD